MSSDRDVTSIVRSWLEEGRTVLPDRVLDAVLDDLPATRQRRATRWPARRQPFMNNTIRITLAAAAVVVVALTGYQILSGSSLSGPGPTDTSPPTLEATPEALTDGPLEPGTYVARPFEAPNDSMSFTFTVPSGWRGHDGIALLPEQGSAGPDGMGIGFALVGGLYSDPCHTGPPDVGVGPSVEDLVAALQEQSGYEATTPTEVTLSGYSGKQMDLLMPVGVEYTGCYGVGFTVWEGSMHAQGPGNVWHLWILDVDGLRVVILAQDNPGTSAQDKAELLAIVDSIVIEP